MPKVNLVDGGMLTHAADVYVNAANVKGEPYPTFPKTWGGIAGAIQDQLKTDPNSATILEKHWNKALKDKNPIKAGSAAFVTNPDNPTGEPAQLKFTKNPHGLLVHAGAPIWPKPPKSPSKADEDNLKQAYLQTLNEIQAHNKKAIAAGKDPIKSAAIPPLGTGIYGVPADKSAAAAAQALHDFKKANEHDNDDSANFSINFCLYENPKNKSDTASNIAFGKELARLLQDDNDLKGDFTNSSKLVGSQAQAQTYKQLSPQDLQELDVALLQANYRMASDDNNHDIQHIRRINTATNASSDQFLGPEVFTLTNKAGGREIKSTEGVALNNKDFEVMAQVLTKNMAPGSVYNVDGDPESVKKLCQEIYKTDAHANIQISQNLKDSGFNLDECKPTANSNAAQNVLQKVLSPSSPTTKSTSTAGGGQPEAESEASRHTGRKPG